MDTVVVFKGGFMDGIEITYLPGCCPDEGEVILVHRPSPDPWNLGQKNEVYVFVSDLFSWVYDHESEVVEKEE